MSNGKEFFYATFSFQGIGYGVGRDTSPNEAKRIAESDSVENNPDALRLVAMPVSKDIFLKLKSRGGEQEDVILFARPNVRRIALKQLKHAVKSADGITEEILNACEDVLAAASIKK